MSTQSGVKPNPFPKMSVLDAGGIVVCFRPLRNVVCVLRYYIRDLLLQHPHHHSVCFQWLRNLSLAVNPVQFLAGELQYSSQDSHYHFYLFPSESKSSSKIHSDSQWPYGYLHFFCSGNTYLLITYKIKLLH